MTQYITGRDPLAASWPIKCTATKIETNPTGYTSTGGTAPAILNDSLDTTYVGEANINQYFRVTCAPFTLPVGARIFSCFGTARARLQSGNTRYKDFLTIVGDHSAAKAARKEIPSTDVHHSLSSGFLNFNSASTSRNSQGQLLSQTDLQKGMYVLFGLNTVYGSLSQGAQIAEAYLNYQYDLPPTATFTNPVASGTINDTAAPRFEWDYFDDFHSQIKFQLQVLDNASNIIHDSGVVSSSDTSYQLPINLANGNYTARIKVYQWWGLGGNDFGSLNWSTVAFTVNVLTLGSPRLSIVDVPDSKEFLRVLCYPDINLLDFDTSTVDRGPATWIANATGLTVNGAVTTPVRDGLQALQVTMTATSGSVGSRQRTYAGNRYSANNILYTDDIGGQVFNAVAYVNPLALAGRTAQMGIVFRNVAGNQLSELFGPVTTLATNAYTAIAKAGAIAPAGTAYVQVRINIGSATIGDVLYIDDVGLWHGGGAVRHNLSTNPNAETSTANWATQGSNPPTLTRDTSKFHSGTASFKLAYSGSNTFGDGMRQDLTGLVVGKEYTVGADVWIDPGGVAACIIGAGLGFSKSSTLFGAWDRIIFTFTATATTHSFVVSTEGLNGNPDTYNMWVDNILVEQASFADTYFDGSTAGAAWDGTANLSTSTLTSTMQTWSRGGFFEFTPNRLRYADSTFDDDSYLWIPSPSFPTTILAADSTQQFHGTRSLKLTPASGTNVTVRTILGTNYYLAGDLLATSLNAGFAAVRCTAGGKTMRMYFNFYKSDFTASSTPSNFFSGTTVANSWAYLIGTISMPSDATYFTVEIEIQGLPTTADSAWIDAVSVFDSAYENITNPTYYAGYYSTNDTDQSPTLLVEYLDSDRTDWRTLQSLTVGIADESFIFDDYTIRNGITRQYRATLLQNEHGVSVDSNPSSSTPATSKSFKGVWISSDSDPGGTSYNFPWDGKDRSETLDAGGTLVPVEGREFPLAQFGTQSDASVQLGVWLESAADKAAMLNFARNKSQVIYRDGRGRSYRGIMGKVTIADIRGAAQLQLASFTLQPSGDQP